MESTEPEITTSTTPNTSSNNVPQVSPNPKNFNLKNH